MPQAHFDCGHQITNCHLTILTHQELHKGKGIICAQDQSELGGFWLGTSSLKHPEGSGSYKQDFRTSRKFALPFISSGFSIADP